MRRLSLLVVAVSVAVFATPWAGAGASSGRPVALVTAETANEVLAVSLGVHDGKIVQRVHLQDPVTIAAAECGPAVAVSPSGTVTLLARGTLRRLRVIHSFRSPQLAAVVPGNGNLVYVTDAATGDLSVIDLARRKVVDRVFVGFGAHHLAVSSAGGKAWVALSETAATIVRLDISQPRRPRVVGRLHPAVAAHDLAFAPGGRTVWVTSASAPVVSVYAAADGRLLHTIPAGRAPQHLAFDRGRALVTSGYGSSLESVSLRTHRRLHLVSAPYGSFNLATYGGFVVTTSLLTGQVSEFRLGDLHRVWTRKVAPEARAIAISFCTSRA